ncbi:hypothetical protein SESBI_29147 [Sesbania bispinosa]|nr:hypothetical protein SESBI_29147 [Sesbania bispinosa]
MDEPLLPYCSPKNEDSANCHPSFVCPHVVILPISLLEFKDRLMCGPSSVSSRDPSSLVEALSIGQNQHPSLQNCTNNQAMINDFNHQLAEPRPQIGSKSSIVS